jgi:hypothetical protein
LISTQPSLLARRQSGRGRANVKIFANRFLPLHRATIVKANAKNCSYSDIRKNPFTAALTQKLPSAEYEVEQNIKCANDQRFR